MGLSHFNKAVLKCIRSKIIHSGEISKYLNVEMGTVKDTLNWLVNNDYITPEGQLTKKGFNHVPVAIKKEELR